MSTMWKTMVHTLLTSSFLLDTHIADLATREPKDVKKQIIEMVKDLTCKYLCPQESEDLRVPMKIFQKVLQDLPKNKSSVKSQKKLWPMRWRHTWKNAIEFMEQAHTAAGNALKELKKTTPVIPCGPFRLLLQVLCQLVIKLWGHHIRQVKKEAPEGCTILGMLPSPTAGMNLPASVKTLAAALVYLMKTEIGIVTSINNTAKIFDVSEKKLRQGT